MTEPRRLPKESDALPRKQAIKVARRALVAVGGRGADGSPPYIQFQYWCSHCHTLCTFLDENKLPLTGQCYRCGYVQKIEKAVGILFETRPTEERYGLVLQEGITLSSGNAGNGGGGGAGPTPQTGPT